MSAAQKFVFGTDFREGSRRGVGEADLAAARAEGYAAGRAEGLAEGRAAGEAAVRSQVDAALQERIVQLLRQAEHLIAEADGRASALEEEAVQLALVTARALAGAALAERPSAGLETIVRECFGHARRAPHLAVRVHEGAVEAMEKHLAGLSRETGFSGRVVVLGEPDLAPGDGRVEWADGGMVLDRAAVQRAIEQSVERAFGQSTGGIQGQGEAS